MKNNSAAKFRRILLVNWLDLPYAQVDLDESVTIFEGGNGAGKSTVLLAALVTLMPDKKQLRSRKVTIERNVEEAIYHRLQPDEPTAYAALEIQLADEIILAGVHLTKQREPGSIALEVFTVRRWPDRNSAQDFFRSTEGDREWTCNLNELRQRAGEWGVEFHAHPTLMAYFKELYDLGVLPLPMAADSDRSQYAHLLETSMAGGISSALFDRLKNYLLPEYEKLPEATRLMHDNLLACIGTKTELTSSKEQYGRLASLIQNLRIYITAWGTRISREKEAANEKLRITETNLQTTLESLAQLRTEKAQLTEKQQDLEGKRKAALANLQSRLDDRRAEEKHNKEKAGALTARRGTLQTQWTPLDQSRQELEKTASGIKRLELQCPPDPTGAQIEAQLKAEIERLQEECRQVEELQRQSEAELFALKENKGASLEIVRLAQRVGGTPVIQRYSDVTDLKEAARLEAKLGPLVQGLIVKDLTRAAGQIAKLDTAPAEVWLTASKDPANDIVSEPVGCYERVTQDNTVRITKRPDRTVLGEAARKKRIKELELHITKAKQHLANLRAVTGTLEDLRRSGHRISDEYMSRPLSWLQSQAASRSHEISQLNSEIEQLILNASAIEAEITVMTGQFQTLSQSFQPAERELGEAMFRNNTNEALKDDLRRRLETEKTNGIAAYTALQAIWGSISELPELATLAEGDLPDVGAALERLRASVEQVDAQRKILSAIPATNPEDLALAASDMQRVRHTVRAFIQTIQPNNLTESNQPEVVIQALTERISTLTSRLEEQETVFRNNIDTIADAIHSEINKRRQRVLRWSNDLKQVTFGTVKGIRLRLEPLPEQLQILDGLRQQKELFAQNQKDPKAALQEFWKQRTGQDLTTEDALDYRRFVTLLIELGDGHGKWRVVGGSTGEMTGAALSILIVLLRAWEEEASLRERVHPLRLLFLDEAARLDATSQATLEALSTGLSTQLVVAAPAIAASGRFTHYVLSRKDDGGKRQVIIRGRRKFCEPMHEHSPS